MLITSSEATSKKISFKVQTARLLDAIKHTDIALGTSAKPIPMDTFVTISDADLYEFKSGEVIKFQLIEAGIPADENIKLELVACRIYNIGQDFNARFVILPNPWENIFDTSPENILELPDGSLTIKPVCNVCAITVAEGLNDKTLNNYVSYKVIFKTTIDIKQSDGKSNLRTFYFVIDPLIKVTSGGRRS